MRETLSQKMKWKTIGVPLIRVTIFLWNEQAHLLTQRRIMVTVNGVLMIWHGSRFVQFKRSSARNHWRWVHTTHTRRMNAKAIFREMPLGFISTLNCNYCSSPALYHHTTRHFREWQMLFGKCKIPVSIWRRERGEINFQHLTIWAGGNTLHRKGNGRHAPSEIYCISSKSVIKIVFTTKWVCDVSVFRAEAKMGNGISVNMKV